MSYAFCVVPVAPIRTKPAHEAEMSSQLLFGEHVEVVSTPENGFVEVVCSHDGYRGFCAANQLLECAIAYEQPDHFAGDWTNTIQDGKGLEVRVPFGSLLPEFLRVQFDYTGVRRSTVSVFSEAALSTVIGYYLNTPYLWGGRSVLGIDCSGFAQAVCRYFGIALPRDAWQQASIGELISFGDHWVGDLAFFELNGKVVHVGVITGADEITHAYGKVRRDVLTEKGIIHLDSEQMTHRLHSIRRIR